MRGVTLYLTSSFPRKIGKRFCINFGDSRILLPVPEAYLDSGHYQERRATRTLGHVRKPSEHGNARRHELAEWEVISRNGGSF